MTRKGQKVPSDGKRTGRQRKQTLPFSPDTASGRQPAQEQADDGAAEEAVTSQAFVDNPPAGPQSKRARRYLRKRLSGTNSSASPATPARASGDSPPHEPADVSPAGTIDFGNPPPEAAEEPRRRSRPTGLSLGDGTTLVLDPPGFNGNNTHFNGQPFGRTGRIVQDSDFATRSDLTSVRPPPVQPARRSPSPSPSGGQEERRHAHEQVRGRGTRRRSRSPPRRQQSHHSLARPRPPPSQREARHARSSSPRGHHGRAFSPSRQQRFPPAQHIESSEARHPTFDLRSAFFSARNERHERVDFDYDDDMPDLVDATDRRARAGERSPSPPAGLGHSRRRQRSTSPPRMRAHRQGDHERYRSPSPPRYQRQRERSPSPPAVSGHSRRRQRSTSPPHMRAHRQDDRERDRSPPLQRYQRQRFSPQPTEHRDPERVERGHRLGVGERAVLEPGAQTQGTPLLQVASLMWGPPLGGGGHCTP